MNCYPVEILNLNVSTNIGAARCLRYVDRIVRARALLLLYSMGTLDVVTYMWALRQLYNVAEIWPELKMYCNIQFGLWHPGKMCVNRVWEKHFMTIVAPAFLAVYDGQCSSSVTFASLQGQLVFLTDLALAYERVKPIYRKIYSRPNGKAIKLHFEQFFEFFLPVVRQRMVTFVFCVACLRDFITYLAMLAYMAI